MSKLFSTLKICFTIFMARTFGRYLVTVHMDFDYAIYEWRGHRIAIPTTPIEDSDYEI